MNTVIITRLILILVVSTLLNGCTWPLFAKQTSEIVVPSQPEPTRLKPCGRVITDLSVPWEQRHYRCSDGGTLPQLVTTAAPLRTQAHHPSPTIISRTQFFVPFKSGQSSLDAVGMKVIRKHQRQLTAASRIEIRGQADRSGPRSVNLRLARERADKVSRTLVGWEQPGTSKRIYEPRLNADRPGVLVSISR